MCSHCGTECCMPRDSMKQMINNVVDEIQCVLSVVRTVVSVEVAVIWDVMVCDVDTFCRETVS
jgi:hypothetical protein